MKTLLLFLIIFFFSIAAYSQNNCLENKTLHTTFISEGSDSSKLQLPLAFLFTPDSILAAFPVRNAEEFLAYKILSKKCSFNDSFTKGTGIFKVRLTNKNGELIPELTVTLNPSMGVRIELLFRDGSKQIFTSL